MNTGVSLILALAIFLLVKGLTRPISALNKATARISRGDYNERVSLRRQDELGELAQNFNIMAQAIQDHTQALTRAAEEKQRFVDNLAHELRTPLTAIQGYSEYLENAHCTEEERIRAAGHLSKAAARLQNLSFKLLDLTYLRTRNLQPEQLNVSGLFKELSSIMEPFLKEKGIILKIEEDLEHLWGDETLLLSLLSNLLDNAIQATATGGQITIKAYSAPNPILEVSDQGRGMDSQEIQRVLEPFYRTDKSRSRKNGGVGLGLTLCAQIAALHHAELSIDSQPGKGTSVKVIFTTPLHQPDNLIKNSD
ncbi:MAG: sensor histidine kinase [Clostridia bacterium]